MPRISLLLLLLLLLLLFLNSQPFSRLLKRTGHSPSTFYS